MINVLDWRWWGILHDFIIDDHMCHILQSLSKELIDGATIYPPIPLLCNAYTLTPLHDIKVVIIWQDPYHGDKQADWLCFSVPETEKIPPSLINIFKEISAEYLSHRLNDHMVSDISLWRIHGNLERRAKQWVCLLNSVLSVQANKPLSHNYIWRERLTNKTIKIINEETVYTVFLLRWKHAQTKLSLIDKRKHLILCAPHPSPLSAYRWFLGCDHFAQANEYLIWHNKQPIIR